MKICMDEVPVELEEEAAADGNINGMKPLSGVRPWRHGDGQARLPAPNPQLQHPVRHHSSSARKTYRTILG